MKRKKFISLFGAVIFTILTLLQIHCGKIDTAPGIDFTIDLTNGYVTDAHGSYQTQITDYYNLSITGGFVYVNGLIVFKGLDGYYYALSQNCTYDNSN